VRTPLKKHARCLLSLKRNVWYSWKLSNTGRLRHTCLVDVFRAMVGRFHPATRRLKEIVDSGELGTLTKIEANLLLTSGFMKDDDIRMVYDLGGGGMMDMGCEFYSTIFPRISRFYSPTGHTLSVSRYLSSADPTKVISAKSDVHPKFPQIDLATTATLAFPAPGGTSGARPADGLTATLNVNFRHPAWLGIVPRLPNMSVRVTGTRGTAELSNFILPWIYHDITVESSEQEGGRLKKRAEKRYGNLGWTT
jgi:predicted dehydrogenase